VNFIGKFEESIVRYAKDYSVDGVLCGHIHTAAMRTIGSTSYYNCGDWVESCTAMVEHSDGRMELLSFDPSLPVTTPLADEEETPLPDRQPALL
jgi:UDP-2,3-diacylglucosamine pyrophosphatase LpxH